MTITWVRLTSVPEGFCTLIAFVQAWVMPGNAAGRAFTPSRAAWICSGFVSAFQATVTTWMTDAGAVSLARATPRVRKVAAMSVRRNFFMGRGVDTLNTSPGGGRASLDEAPG